MRVCFVAHRSHDDTLGGADRSLLNLLDGVADLGWETCVLLARPGVFAEELHTRGIAYHVTSHWNAMGPPLICPRLWHAPRRIVSRLRRGQRNTLAARRAREVLRRYRPDVIYTNSVVTDFGYHLAGSLKLPHIWHIRELPDPSRGICPDVGWRAYRQKLAQSALCIAISHTVRNRTLHGLPSSRVPVIYNGVMPRRRFHALAAKRVDWRDRQTAPPTFAIVGGIAAAKGQLVAIDAIHALAQAGTKARLLIIGSGDDSELRERVNQLGVCSLVELNGYHADPWPQLAAVDAVLMCSPDEPMGRVTAEAMAACLPVIGYHGGATPELITHRHTGLLYQSGAVDLARQMLWIINNPQAADTIAARAWTMALERFSQETYIRHVVAAVEACLPPSRTQRPHLDCGIQP